MIQTVRSPVHQDMNLLVRHLSNVRNREISLPPFHNVLVRTFTRIVRKKPYWIAYQSSIYLQYSCDKTIRNNFIIFTDKNELCLCKLFVKLKMTLFLSLFDALIINLYVNVTFIDLLLKEKIGPTIIGFSLSLS